MSLLSLEVSQWLVCWQESQQATKFANCKILCKFLWVAVKATGFSTFANLAISICKYFYATSFTGSVNEHDILVNKISMCRQSLFADNIWLKIHKVEVKLTHLFDFSRFDGTCKLWQLPCHFFLCKCHSDLFFDKNLNMQPNLLNRKYYASFCE